jgi:hypothetical protein
MVTYGHFSSGGSVGPESPMIEAEKQFLQRLSKYSRRTKQEIGTAKVVQHSNGHTVIVVHRMEDRPTHNVWKVSNTEKRADTAAFDVAVNELLLNEDFRWTPFAGCHSLYCTDSNNYPSIGSIEAAYTGISALLYMLED